MLYSLWEFFQHGLDQFLAFRRISDCRLLLGWSWRDIALYEYFSAYFYESLLCRKRFLVESVFLSKAFSWSWRDIALFEYVFEVWEYTSIVYALTPSLFSRGIEWSTVRVGLKTTLGLWFGCFQVEDLEYFGSGRIARNESVLRWYSRF